jgi:N-acetylneuraminic acid mutarotase
MKKHIAFLFIFHLTSSIFHFTFAQGPWSQRATMPGLARHRIFAFSIGSRGYIGCGWNGTDMYDDVWEYDPGSNSWAQKASYPGGPRLCPFSFAIGNYGYVGAGLDQFLTSMNDFYRYDPASNSWTSRSNFAGSPRFGCASAVYNNKGYVAMGDEWDPSYYRQNDLWRYDPSLDQWSYVSAWPTDGRRDPVGFCIGNKLYFGTGSDNSYIEQNDLWCFDPSNGSWTQKANCGNDPRAQATGFAVNGKGYVGLGQVQTGEDMTDFLEYEPVNNTWRYINSFPASARENCYAFVIGSKAYTACGTSGINYNDLWEFDPSLATGIIPSNKNETQVNIFPNPLHTSSVLQIPGINSIEGVKIFELFDANGKKVRNFTLTQAETKMEREDLSIGIYFYHVLCGSKPIASGKLSVQ